MLSWNEVLMCCYLMLKPYAEHFTSGMLVHVNVNAAHMPPTMLPAVYGKLHTTILRVVMGDCVKTGHYVDVNVTVLTLQPANNTSY